MTGELTRLAREASDIAEDVQAQFGALRPDQLNWKPHAEEWSVAECLQHLILLNASYFPVLDRIERGEHDPRWIERVPLLPRLFGALVERAVRPETRMKSKASPEFRPAASADDGRVVARFVAHQKDVVTRMLTAESRGVAGVVMTSPVASLVTYSVRDACRIIVTHERRHIAQAKRLPDAPGFPSG